MAKRDDFRSEVVTALAGRAGYRCSHPACRALTIGPSDETETGRNSVGVAAHITAAAPGGPRFDPSLSQEQRRGYDNGIWLCANHARDVDNDESRHTVELLRGWRAIAEEEAREFLGLPTETGRRTRSMIPTVVMLDEKLAINTWIGETLRSVMLREAWGKELGHAVRDLVIEIARNASSHGGARVLKLTVRPESIVLEDDGAPFSLEELALHPAGGGGQDTYRNFTSMKAAAHLLVSREGVPGNNRLSVARVTSLAAVPALSTCSLVLKHHQSDTQFRIDPRVLRTCSIVHIVLPLYMTASDALMLRRELTSKFAAGTGFVFYFEDLSAFALTPLQAGFPSARFVQVGDD